MSHLRSMSKLYPLRVNYGITRLSLLLCLVPKHHDLMQPAPCLEPVDGGILSSACCGHGMLVPWSVRYRVEAAHSNSGKQDCKFGVSSLETHPEYCRKVQDSILDAFSEIAPATP